MNLVECIVNASQNYIKHHGVRAKYLYLGSVETEDLRKKIIVDYVNSNSGIPEGSTFNGMEIVTVKRDSFLAVGP